MTTTNVVTIKEAMDRAARQCSLTPPTSWILSTALSTVEMKDFLAETIDELQDRVDWPNITLESVITGSGVEEYDLPDDFLRLTRDAFTVYETTSTRRPGIPVTSDGKWTALKQLGSASGDRYYRLVGDPAHSYKIGFFNKPGTSDSITVSYISTDWLYDPVNPTARGDIWTADIHELLLPRRLVELGVTFRFRRRKGMPYADILGEYEMRLSRAANDAHQIKKVNMGGTQGIRSPFDIPIPNFIPPAS